MKKRSRKSNGYVESSKRGTSNRFTPREIRALIAMAVIFVAVVATVIFVPEFVDRAQYHIVDVDADGQIEGMSDNWLVTNLNDGGAKKYSHLGNVDPVDGYALAGTGYITDANERTIYFAAEDATIPEYTATVAKGEYDAMAASVLEGQRMVLTETLDASEVRVEQIDGINVAYCWINGTIDSMYDSEGNPIEPEYDDEGNAVYPQKYVQTAYCYVDSPIPERSVLLCATMYNEEENVFVAPDAMIELLMTASRQIHYL